MISVKIILYAMSSLQSLQMFLGMQFDIVEINYHDGKDEYRLVFFERYSNCMCLSKEIFLVLRGCCGVVYGDLYSLVVEASVLIMI